MPQDRDQLTPDDPDDREHLEQNRGQGTGGSGQDVLPGEEPIEYLGEDPDTGEVG
jgi:hypothetical protein